MHYAGAEVAGGLLSHLSHLAGGLVEAGHEVHVIVSPAPAADGAAERCASSGAAITRLRVTGKTDAAGVNALRRLVSRQTPDIFHLHLSSPVESIPVILAARIGGAKRLVATEHSPTWYPLKRFYSAGAKRMAGKLLSATIAVCESDARFLIREFGLAADSVRVIPNGVAATSSPLPRALARERLGVPADAAVVLGYAGEIETKKGVGDLLEAVARSGLPRTVLALAGEGSLREPLLREAAGLPFLLLLPGRLDRIDDFLAALDIFLFASWQEALPLAVLEAMAAGLPIVATRVGGIPEAVEDEISGLLVDPRSPEQIASALLRLVDDPAACRSIGESARRAARNRYSVSEMVRRVEEVYLEALAG